MSAHFPFLPLVWFALLFSMRLFHPPLLAGFDRRFLGLQTPFNVSPATASLRVFMGLKNRWRQFSLPSDSLEILNAVDDFLRSQAADQFRQPAEFVANGQVLIAQDDNAIVLETLRQPLAVQFREMADVKAVNGPLYLRVANES